MCVCVCACVRVCVCACACDNIGSFVTPCGWSVVANFCPVLQYPSCCSIEANPVRSVTVLLCGPSPGNPSISSRSVKENCLGAVWFHIEAAIHRHYPQVSGVQSRRGSLCNARAQFIEASCTKQRCSSNPCCM